MSKKYITDNIKIDGQLLDGSGSAGTSGQILSSTGTATDWINLSDISGVDGSGSAERLAVWSDSDTISYHDNLRWDGEKLMVESGNSSTSSKTVSITHIRNDSNVSTQAITIDANFSGADTTTTDRTNAGLYIDLDSSADGDASNEVRSYGVWVDARITGYNDLLRGGYFFVESNNTTEKTAEITGVYGLATHDSSSTNGGVSNMYGVRGVTAIQDYGDVDNTYAVHGLVQIANNRNANVDNTHALYGEIQIDEATALSYGSMYGCRVVIDNNEGSVPTFSDQYLFYGAYQGTTATGAYGIYVQGDRHYLAGSVGIGETNPARALEVKHSTQQGVARFVSGSTTMAFIDLKDANTTADNKVRFGAVGNELSLWANGGERMRIDSSGNVGIGETNPLVPLHISRNTASGENIALILDNNNTTAGNEIGMLFRSAVGSTNTDFEIFGKSNAANDMDLVFQSDGSVERVRFTADGNVGIGTTNPVLFSSGWGKVLGVSAASNYAAVQISGGSGSGGEIDLGDASIRHAAIASITGSHLGFYTNSTNTGDGVTERIRITSNGNVGINETNPAFKLDVNGSVAITEYLYHKGDSNTYLRFSGDMVQLVAGGVEMIRIVEDTQDEVVINENSADVDFRVESDTDTHALFLEGSSGNVGIGTSSPGSELEVDGEITTTTITYPEPGAIDASGYNGEIVYFGSQISMSEGKLMVLSTSVAGATWYQAKDSTSSLATGMLGIALGTTASAGLLVRGIAKNSAWSSFSEGEKLYLSPTSGAISNSITSDTNDFVRIIGYALGGNKIYFCPDNSYVQNS